MPFISGIGIPPLALRFKSPCSAACPPVCRPHGLAGWASQPWRACIYCLLAALPIGFVVIQVATWVRNIPNWDEFDSVLGFMIALDAGASVSEIAQRLFEVANEHRTFASRLIFASTYWLFGGVNFIALAVLGNLFLAAVFWQLLARVDETAPRLRLAAIFALIAFQLQHHENLFWAGASIDHFFVVLAVVVALAALTSHSRWSLPLACGAAFLATFSLAHGLLVWFVGGALLWAEHRRRDCVVWTMAAALALALFFTGFQVNPGHHLPALAELPQVLVFWLTIAGSSPALDDVTIAPWPGGILVVTTVLVLWRGCHGRERLACATIAWCLGAMAMIAWGRALLSNAWAPITSRYVILSSIAWALLVWVLVERAVARRGREPAWLALGFAVLIAFNFAANSAHLAAGRVFAQNGERAVQAFHRDGTFDQAEMPLYPDPERADAVIREAAERRIFRLPERTSLQLCRPTRVVLTNPLEIDDVLYFIEQVEDGPAELRVRGWGFRPDQTARLGHVSVVFRSEDRLFAFEATPCLRPDVAEEFERWDAIYSGFQLTLPQDELPEGAFNIGVGFAADNTYMMTANTIIIAKAVPADEAAAGADPLRAGRQARH